MDVDLQNSTPNRSQLAFTGLLSILVFIPLAVHHEDLLRSTLIWLVYVAVCGVINSVPSDARLTHVIKISLVPSLILFATSAFLTWLALYAETLNICATCGGDDFNQERFYKQIFIYLIVVFPTVIGITLATFARTEILKSIDSLNKLNPKNLKSFEKKIKILISIIGIIGICLLGSM